MAPIRPTILQIIPALDAGGAELSTVEIAGAVVAAGGRALVATEGGRLAQRITDAGGEIIPLRAGSKNPARMMANARALAALIRREHVDLVHARSRAPAWSALAAARATKRPFVTTYHGAYAEQNALKRAYNSVMARGDIVIANSAYTAGLIQARYGAAANRVRIIHRGVDPLAFDPAAIGPERRERLRASLGVPSGAQVVLHPARLTRWKGQGVLIEALARLQQDGSTPWFAVLAGDEQGRTGYVTELHQQLASHGLAGRVRLAGHVEDMAAAYAIASVTVIASTEPEAFGRTAIEAQMMGCPVIATAIGAPPETVVAEPADARTGWLLPPGDADALAAAVETVLNLLPADRAALASRARKRATGQFSLAAMKWTTLKVYDELLETRLARAFEAAEHPADS